MSEPSSFMLLFFDNKFVDSGNDCKEYPKYYYAEAKSGEVKAQFKLSQLLEIGEEKYFWLLEATKNGHQEASRILVRDADTYNIKEAKKYLSMYNNYLNTHDKNSSDFQSYALLSVILLIVLSSFLWIGKVRSNKKKLQGSKVKKKNNKI